MAYVVEALPIHRQWRRLVALIFLISVIQSGFFINPACAETWICPRQGQSDLYTDRGLPGCRLMGEPKTYSPLESSPVSRSPRAAIIPPPVSSTNYPSNPSKSYSRPPVPFPEVSLTVPLLSVGQNNAGSITGSWGGFVAQLTIGYKADGKGPEILGDSNLMPVSAYSFHTAVMVATKAVGYDPRYLSVRILVPARLDGPSAGGIFAVGIAAALLGDPIRQDVCMSGTIEPDAEIQAVGRLVDKMSACRDLRKTTMIVPDALDNSHLNFTGAEKSIQVIEVHTFSEAYNAATGQALRQVP